MYNEKIPQQTELDFFSNNLQTPDSTNFSNNNLKNYFIGGDYYSKKKKYNFMFKVNYLTYKINKKSYLESFNTPSNFMFDDLENSSPNNIDIFLSEMDYNYKLDSISKIELGGKAVFQKLDNQNNFYTISQNGQKLFDSQRPNDYSYKEWVIGAYAQYYRKINKLDFTLGSRIEFNPSDGKSRTTNFRLERELTNFFPFN